MGEKQGVQKVYLTTVAAALGAEVFYPKTAASIYRTIFEV